jgi:uncharacterized membrane protein
MNAPLPRRRPSGRGLAALGPLALGLAALLCQLVGLYAVALAASGFRLLPADIAANGFPVALKAHIVTAGVALLLVPWQLVPAMRRRAPRAHRLIGRGYVVAALMGGLSGFLAAFQTRFGPVAAGGFAVLGILWTATTAAALVSARRGDLVAHRRWALRSFALGFAAVTLRVYLPVAGAAGITFATAYPFIAWLSWVPNLLLTEYLLGRGPRVEQHLEVPHAPLRVKPGP